MNTLDQIVVDLSMGSGSKICGAVRQVWMNNPMLLAQAPGPTRGKHSLLISGTRKECVTYIRMIGAQYQKVRDALQTFSNHVAESTEHHFAVNKWLKESVA